MTPKLRQIEGREAKPEYNFFCSHLDLLFSFLTFDSNRFAALVWHHRPGKTGRKGAQRCWERKRGRDDWRNKLFLCLPWLAWCLVPGIRVAFLHCKPYCPHISIFHGGGCEPGYSVVPGLIMQGLGKTERGEQGRDIDLTSLRSTMPAGGPLQVSAFRKSFNGQLVGSVTRTLFSVLSRPFSVPQSSSICDSTSLFLSRLYHSDVVCPAYVRVEDQRAAVGLCGFISVSEINLRWQHPWNIN